MRKFLFASVFLVAFSAHAASAAIYEGGLVGRVETGKYHSYNYVTLQSATYKVHTHEYRFSFDPSLPFLSIGGPQGGQSGTGDFFDYTDSLVGDQYTATGVVYDSNQNNGGAFTITGIFRNGVLLNWHGTFDAGDQNFATNEFYSYSGTISSSLGVPEPASWAMLLGGFGLAGASVRRRGRQTVRVTYA